MPKRRADDRRIRLGPPRVQWEQVLEPGDARFELRDSIRGRRIRARTGRHEH